MANTADTMLARFTHYRDRYVNQIESLKLERLLRESMTELANKLQESTMTANQVRSFRFNLLLPKLAFVVVQIISLFDIILDPILTKRC